MRLFIAILFTPEIKAELAAAADRLRQTVKSGSFTLPENLHLTLAFLGETSRADAAARVMDEIKSAPFKLTLSGCGRFRRSGGDIVWAGLTDNRALADYAARLAGGLRRAGFDIEDREFSPHITLGRQVMLQGKPELGLKPLSMECGSISLMRSDRIDGRLAYTEIYSVKL